MAQAPAQVACIDVEDKEARRGEGHCRGEGMFRQVYGCRGCSVVVLSGLALEREYMPNTYSF